MMTMMMMYESSNRSASPGKVGQFEEEIFRNSQMSDIPLVMSVSLSCTDGQRLVGVAYVDGGIMHLGACEFSDDDHFWHLEAIITQLGPKECVVVKVSRHKHGNNCWIELPRDQTLLWIKAQNIPASFCVPCMH